MKKKIPNPIDVYVGRRVRMRRKMLDMSQEKLGRALDLTFQQVQKYEKGTNRVGSSRLAQIGAILQVPIEFFFEGAPTPPAAGQAVTHAASGKTTSLDNVQSFLSTSDGLSITKNFQMIKSPKVRRIIVGLVAQLASEAE